MFHYLVYNLKLVSQFEIPELPTRTPPSPDNPDVLIEFSEVPTLPPAPREIESRAVRVSQHDVVYEKQDCGRFLVREGREIHVDPFPSIDDRIWRLSLFGPAIGLLLIQRGELVLHGAAVAFGESAVVLVGPAGRGKSTLTSELCRLGGRLLTDDVVVVQDPGEQPVALPGVPLVKLWPDAMERAPLRSNPSLLHPGFDKVGCRIPDGDLARPTRIQQIYFLQYGDRLCRDRLSGTRSFEALMASLFAVRYGQDFVRGLDGKELLGQVGGLASRVPIHILERPRDRDLLAETAELALTGLEPADDPV